MMMQYLIEILISLLGIISTGLMFIIRGQVKRLIKLEDDLTNHRVDDASKFITRTEHDDKMESLRVDIREIIGSLRTEIQSISNYIRETKK